MPIRFVTEAVMLAVYGNLIVPDKPVEFLVPASTITDLYDYLDDPEPIVMDLDPEELRNTIKRLIEFFELPFFAKQIQNALLVPWRKTSALPLADQVTVSVINTLENAEYGEAFNEIDTELILAAIREKALLLTDQFELVDRILEQGIPVIVVDVEDFEYAVESGLPSQLDSES
ncbi:ADP-heptose synthase [Gorillibacterium sp. CAU 1737]|uniref:ADP-heptose synthase n=1 Tax=Gorillibacterium sp. CAU 1737 TaxID=3140362 RepID=UPI003260EA75